MGSLSLDEARAILLDQPTTSHPFEDVSEDAPQPSDDVTLNGMTSEEDAGRFSSLQEAEHALFEATLDAAFGAGGESVAADAQVHLSDFEEDESSSFNDGMVGLGVDIVEIEKMRSILQRTPSFASRVFSIEEQIYCDSRSNPAAHYAVRFAAKEAVVKALGTGFTESIGVQDIEIERAKNGRPLVKLSGAARQVAEREGILEISLSMSYTKTDAVACAMALTKAAVRAAEKRKDPMEELARQFKETRKILDDL